MPGEEKVAFALDYDGRGNTDSPEAQAAEAERTGNVRVDADTITDDEFDALMTGDILSTANNEGRGEAGGEERVSGKTGAEKSDEEDLEARLGKSPLIGNIARGVGALLAGQAAKAQDNISDTGEAKIPTKEDLLVDVRADILKRNPTFDDAAVEWAMGVAMPGVEKFHDQLSARMDRMEAKSGTADVQQQVRNFMGDLDTQLDREGLVVDPEFSKDEQRQQETIRRLAREGVVSRFQANTRLTADRMPAVLKEVKSDLLRISHQGNTRKRRDLERDGQQPSPASRNGQAAGPDVIGKAVKSKRKDLDFGGSGSRKIVEQIVKRVSLT
jgi:hypothetical protein